MEKKRLFEQPLFHFTESCFFAIFTKDRIIVMHVHHLSNQEIRRYDSQIGIPEMGISGQEKLKNAHVLVVGAGSIGSSLLQYLSASGIGSIGIADNALVSESGLNRQILYGSMDLGKQKAIIAKQKIESLNPLNHYEVHVILVQPENSIFICKDYNLVADTTNDKEVTKLLHETCLHLDIPLVTASFDGMELQVTSAFKDNPLPENYFNTYDSSAIRGKKMGIPGPLPGIAGAVMAAEIFKIITGMGEFLKNTIWIYSMVDHSSQLVPLR